MLNLDELRVAIRDDAIDTVAVAFTDMPGRLMGKRFLTSSTEATRSTVATTSSASTWRWTRSRVRDRELGARLRRL